MVIPGFDGHHQVFRSVAERLKIKAATLQLGPDVICESIPEMAKTLANVSFSSGKCLNLSIKILFLMSDLFDSTSKCTSRRSLNSTFSAIHLELMWHWKSQSSWKLKVLHYYSDSINLTCLNKA